MKLLSCYLTAICIFALVKTQAQVLPVGTTALDDYYRRQQLLGNTDSAISFTIRPFSITDAMMQSDTFNPDSTENIHYKYGKTFKAFNWRLLPVNLQTQINTHHPYGWNDGPIIPAKGLQTLFSAGVFLKYGPLRVQIRPEFLAAQNQSFDLLGSNLDATTAAQYYAIYNHIDLPEKFGAGSYTKAYWGQSSISLNFGALSFGASTENIWWGPGIRSSLLMSNTAPGFKHLTLNTLQPVKSPLGTFEAQLIAGRLNGSGYAPLLSGNQTAYQPKPDDWRYLSAMVLSWQPKWVNGLFLGIAQSRQLYSNNLSGVGSYLPFFTALKTDAQHTDHDKKRSLFLRWLWLPERAEVYFEYGKYNTYTGLTAELLNPQYARAYIFGLRKTLPFNRNRNEYLMLNLEVTQLQQTSVYGIRDGQSWYVNNNVPHGYTNEGQLLGAGIGPGAELQSVSVNWLRGLKKIGIQLERYVHNNDFYYLAFEKSADSGSHWVDLSVATDGEWNYNNFIFNARLQAIRSFNYQWNLQSYSSQPSYPAKNALNLLLQAGITYRFNP